MARCRQTRCARASARPNARTGRPSSACIRESELPAGALARDRFVLERRGGRAVLDPWRHQGIVVEDERTADGQIARVATVFLTGRECPWRCTMCDLWKHTTEIDTPPGAIPEQIAAARDELRELRSAVTALKLYNAGSFFDPRAVPVSDYGDDRRTSRRARPRHRRIASRP